ncbi:ArsR/SmtB family transcription factor [Clostridium saccharoperbutylacetonicum]|uniref:ArsR/SmtB family transcription factor n=1 Tax=Clostridium saccharoperbutylacetonicum TaxID=36745 RepID=UPI0039ED93AA
MFNEVEKIDNCNCIAIHHEIVDEVRKDMLEENILSDLADLFNIFGDTTRIKILHVLSKSEMCVCDISSLINMNRSSVSHQLKTLRQAKLVKYRREGTIVYYSLSNDHVKQVFNQGLIHLIED